MLTLTFRKARQGCTSVRTVKRYTYPEDLNMAVERMTGDEMPASEPTLRYTTFLKELSPLYEEDWPVEVDVTESVKVYPTGKVMTCPCGAAMGVNHKTSSQKCFSCRDFIVVDSRPLEREDEEPLPVKNQREAKTEDKESSSFQSVLDWA